MRTTVPRRDKRLQGKSHGFPTFGRYNKKAGHPNIGKPGLFIGKIRLAHSRLIIPRTDMATAPTIHNAPNAQPKDLSFKI